MLLVKNGEVIELTNPIQIAAFKSAGYVEEQPKKQITKKEK